MAVYEQGSPRRMGVAALTERVTALEGRAAVPAAWAWANLTGVPTTFPPSVHSHAWADITGKPTTFTPSAHAHAIADVAGLQAALDAALARANTLLGSVVVGQTAALAINLGIREITVALAGAVAGERYQAFCRSYRLATTGSFIAGRPAGYTVLDCACNAAGQIIVSLNTPLLAIGAAYQMNCDIVKVNT